MEVQVVSQTIQNFNGRTYYKCGEYFRDEGVLLHRAVWEYHFGAIPDGAVVHHIDGNKSNNQIGNLALMSSLSEHCKLHQKLNPKTAMPEECLQAAKIWHHSDSGKSWHKQHYERDCASKMHRGYTRTCSFCGKTFQTKQIRAKYCCPYHSNLARLKSGVDNEKRICVICGNSFDCNKYLHVKTCSKDCKRKLLSQTRKNLAGKKRCVLPDHGRDPQHCSQ